MLSRYFETFFYWYGIIMTGWHPKEADLFQICSLWPSIVRPSVRPSVCLSVLLSPCLSTRLSQQTFEFWYYPNMRHLFLLLLFMKSI